MAYSLDLRKRVVSYVRSGGSKISAHRIFNVSMWCVNDWCNRKDLSPTPSKGRPRKLDWSALSADIAKHPDKLLRERAAEFGVWPNAIWYACRALKHTHKKTFRYEEKNHEARITFLRNLRSIIQKKGSKKVAWIDESGFRSHAYRSYGWGKRGAKVYGERPGKREKQTNLIAAKQGGKLLAPVLYQCSTTALWFNQWLEEHLFKELEENSTLILDNACFHQKETIRVLAKEKGHDVLFLPPYSPDLNPIEKVFAILKKRGIYANAPTTLDQIVKSYGLFLE